MHRFAKSCRADSCPFPPVFSALQIRRTAAIWRGQWLDTERRDKRAGVEAMLDVKYWTPKRSFGSDAYSHSDATTGAHPGRQIMAKFFPNLRRSRRRQLTFGEQRRAAGGVGVVRTQRVGLKHLLSNASRL